MRRILLALVLLLAACSKPPPGAIDETRTITVGQNHREYRLVVPSDRVEPTPLVVMFHGFSGDPDSARRLSAFDDLAAVEGFAVAYPLGAGLIPSWRTDGAMSAPDVSFVRDVVADVGRVIDVDPDRIYAAGMSNGGGMAGRLACEASDLFAAVGVVAAAHGFGACVQERPVPVMAFHGDADWIVPLEGIPFVAQDVTGWVERRAIGNGCDAEPVVSAIQPDVTEYRWTGCEADVVYYEIADGRHGWPGSERSTRGGDSTTTIDATALLWGFFASHPLK